MNDNNLNQNHPNGINQIDNEEILQEDVPQVDSEKKSKGVNKLAFFAIIIVGIVLAFAGIVAFTNQYQAKKAIEKEEEQKAAQKREATTDTGLDIQKAKAQVAAEAAINQSLLEQQAQAANNLNDPNYNPNMVTAAGASTGTNSGYAVAAPNPNQPVNYVQNTAPSNSSGVTVGARDYQAKALMGNPESEKDKIADRKLQGNVLAYGGGGNDAKSVNAPLSLAAGGDDEDMPQNRNTGTNRGTNAFSGQYQSTVFASTSANQRNNLSLLLKAGTLIPCVLKTKIDSTYAGQTACQVTKDVYSANGKTLLIERGSSVIGEQRVQVQQGQARVFVLWSRLETPKGVVVQIDSGATDNLGASGISARVDSHYLKRFGGAILLSLIEDALELLSKDDQSEQNGGVSYNSTSSATNQMAVEALKNTINIPPTAHVHQGALINIFVARDVDFKNVYELANRF